VEEFGRLSYREKISSGVENILIVRLDVIGNQILLYGFLREVRRNFLAAHMTLLVSPIAAPIVEFCPSLTKS